MDEDAELKLQKASSDLIPEFETLLARFLRNERLHVVKHSQANALIRLLEPFQEWPQLLDQHLKRLVPPLISAFVGYLMKSIDQYIEQDICTSEDVIPLPRAISKILYTFCKIRGYKVISHFLNSEPKFLEPMLSAYALWNQVESHHGSKPFQRGSMTWEERYIMLLWTSHLMLTPFDLASISSIDVFKTENLHITLPTAMPSLARHATEIAVQTVRVASKEREAAAILLVRIALRPDMRQYDLAKCMIDWAMASLKFESDETGKKSIYAHIGALSFLAGVVTSADSIIISPYLLIILRGVQAIVAQVSANEKAIYSSALARKLIIKIFRAIIIHTLHNGLEESSHTQLSSEDALEEIIDHILTSLADKDTPVRYAASKALSVITAKLDPAQAADIVEALLGSLEENVSWEDVATGRRVANHDLQNSEQRSLKRDLTAVNPLRWHGLILALSQLLYRRSPPPEQLSSIVNLLLVALCFEQRSAVGASIGTNVRDAACFGIWALARRYTTEELLAIDTSLIDSSGFGEGPEGSVSVLQILANEIVVAACSDSSGNIRRGASAALQELIGRHPDTIDRGIPIVQVVDYHAVALRSRALIDVALGASALNRLYWSALLNGLVGARGIRSVDAPSRRDAATAVGRLARRSPNESLQKVRDCLRSTSNRRVEELQGLVLSLAAIVAVMESDNLAIDAGSISSLTSMSTFFEDIPTAGKDLANPTLRPHLTAEAICKLIATFGSATRSSSPIASIAAPIFHASFNASIEILHLSLGRTEDLVINAATAAARELLYFSDVSTREKLVRSWISTISRPRTRPYGTIAALGAAFEQSDSLTELSSSILHSLLGQLDPQLEIETRVWAMKSLKSCIHTIKGAMSTSLIEAISRCLDDYTTDQRGDVGSLLRLEAIDAADQALHYHTSLSQQFQELLTSKICCLSVEKLDKVRNHAWSCLQNHHNLLYHTSTPPPQVPTTTSTYFTHILALTLTHPYLLTPILTGLVISTASGADSLLRASRAALASHIDTLSDVQLHSLLTSLLTILAENQHNERLLLPILTALAFLGEINVFDRVATLEPPLDWSQSLLPLLGKSHHKSTNVRKVLACIACYSSLAYIPSTRQITLGRLCGLLLHPYPMVSPPDRTIVTSNPISNAPSLANPEKPISASSSWTERPVKARPIINKASYQDVSIA